MWALTHCSVSQLVCRATVEWTQENTSGFIELYEKMSLLWDPNHPKYYNNLHKCGAWEEIAKVMGTVPEECKKGGEKKKDRKPELFIQKII
jgi:hypothetical protein